MRHRMKREMVAFVLVLAAILAVFLVRLWKTTVDRNGSGPAEPFRIAGNLYYVGADNVSAFLVTGPEGHVVLDGGYPNTGPMIIASIAQLGFDITDVKVLLNSIPRRDRAGGLPALQQASGAKLWASESSASVIASGGDDPDIALPIRTLVQIGILGFPPARVDHRFKDGDTIRVGPIALTAHVTGGSTRGCTSWSFPVRDGERSTERGQRLPLEGAPLGMRYPEQRADIERSLRVLRSLPADIWVTSSSRIVGPVPQVRGEQDGKEPGGCFHRPGGLPRLHRHRRGGIPPREGVLACVASHRPSRWSALAQWSGSDDRETQALIKREIAFLACVQIAGAVRLVGPGQPLLDERRAEASPLQFRIDADDQKIPVRFRHEPLMELSHDVIGARESDQWSKADAERHGEHPATDHPTGRDLAARRQPNRDRHPAVRFRHMSVTKTVHEAAPEETVEGSVAVGVDLETST